MSKIPYGISNFKLIRDKSEKYLYIDKTHFLQELEKQRYLIHLRPRRFGKSLFLSMMDNYYDIASADEFDDLFSGLYVHEYPTNDKNNYYILRFNFSGVQNVNEGDLEAGFTVKIRDGIRSFINRYDFDITVNNSRLSADFLSDFLTKFSALKLPNKIYLLIDEYDHFTNSVLNGDGEAFLEVLRRGGFVRSFYEVIKEHTEIGNIERFFITGVMSVTLDSMTSGFNIAKNITANQNFSDIMGFTATEVKEILNSTFTEIARQREKQTIEQSKKMRLTEQEQCDIFEIFKENYNGYLFSEEDDTKIFNSTLIMYYLNAYISTRKPPKNLIDPNLNQSGTTIANIVQLKMPEENQALIREIVEEKEIVGELQPFINIDLKFDQNDVITMLYNIGILTIKPSHMGNLFQMPNKTIQRTYLQYLSDLLKRQLDYHFDTRKLTVAFRELGEKGQLTKLTKIVEDILFHASNRNYRELDEAHIKNMYFVLTYITEDFVVYDEQPAGNGYADVFIQRSLTSRAKYEALIEFKYLKKKEITNEKIEEKMVEGRKQLTAYLKDERLSSRLDLRKYVILFSGSEAIRIEEVC